MGTRKGGGICGEGGAGAPAPPAPPPPRGCGAGGSSELVWEVLPGVHLEPITQSGTVTKVFVKKSIGYVSGEV